MTVLGARGPLPASAHRGLTKRRSVDAVAMLTAYVVLLFAIPSNVTIVGLGPLGRPSLIWGLILMVFWPISRLQRRALDVRPTRQPIRFMFAAVLVIALVSLSAALLRGQPSDQVSPAFTAILRLLSWSGVMLVAMDGIRTMNDLSKLVRRIAIAAGLLALLGVLQFLTKQYLIDFFGMIPGLSSSGGGIGERAGVTRAAGTAIHPLEYATAICAALPLVIAAAISHGFSFTRGGGQMIYWLSAGLIAVSSFVGVSRSAIIGFAVGAVGIGPLPPKRYLA